MSEEQFTKLKEIRAKIFDGQKTFGKRDVEALLELITEQAGQILMFNNALDESAKVAQQREARIHSLEERISLCEEED